ncbi:MAG: hypothetical protein WDN08_05490 [Rhizomicrobium sp.]
MTDCGCNQVLAILGMIGRAASAEQICMAIDADAPRGAHTPLRRRVLKALGRLRERFLVSAMTFEGVDGTPTGGRVAHPRGITVYGITREGMQFLRRGDKIACGARISKVTAPRIVADTFRERLWRALRIKKRGTLPELIATARRDSDSEKTDVRRAQLSRRAGARRRGVRPRAEEPPRPARAATRRRRTASSPSSCAAISAPRRL